MNCNYKVKLDDIQNKYKFNIFCTGSYNDSDLRKMIESVYYALPRVNGSGTSVTLNDTAFSYMKNKLYVTEMSQEGTPTPETPQPIHTISGDNEVVVCGKNLFDKDNANIINGYFTPSSPTITSNSNHRTIYIPIQPNTTYTIQKSNAGGDKARFGIGTTTITPTANVAVSQVALENSATSQTITTNSTANYLVVWCYFTDNTSITESELLATIQLELGDTVSTYEPYQSNSVLLTLGDKEICKIGNYEDKIFKAIKGNEIYDSLASEEKATLDYGKWYLRKAIGKYIFNGTETYTKVRDYIFSTTLADAVYPADTSYLMNCLCDKYTRKSNQANWDNYDYLISYYSATTKIAFRNKDTKEITDFQTLLASSNVELYYQKATPTNELFNDTIQDQLEDIYNNMLSYEGQTNVSQVNEDLPFNINSTALKDLNNL